MAKRVFSLVTRIALLGSQQGGYASNQEICITLGIASQQAFNALLPAKSPRPVGPGLNRELDTRLAPFIRRQGYSTSATLPDLPMTAGQFALPAECAYVDYYDIADAVTVEEVSGAALRYKLTDAVNGPTPDYPVVATVAGGTKQLYPRGIARVEVQFYARPTEPVYFEDYSAGEAAYVDDKSVDAGWDEDMEPELLVRSLRLLGLEIRDPALMQVAAQLTAESL